MIKNMTDSEFQDILFGCSRSGSLKKISMNSLTPTEKYARSR